MTVLVTGASGQVGRALGQAMACLGLARCDLDITDEAAVEAAVRRARPAVIVNCAAYTDVEGAEDDEAGALRINGEGAANLARAAARHGAILVQLSTDFVFDGAKSTDYMEDDEPAPLNAYGRTKLAGEEAVRRHAPRHVVLRTAWVFDGQGRNFVRAMRRLADEGRRELTVVCDQVGGPTAAADIAAAISRIVEVAGGHGFDAWGTYHHAGRPAVSWHEFAKAILADHPEIAVEPIASADWPARARRPARAVLGGERLASVFGLAPPDWRPALRRALAEG